MERPRDEEIHVATEEEMEEVRRLLAKADARKESPLKGMRGGTCPVCNQPTMDYADDLVYESYRTGERVVITGLTGTRCRNCGDQAYDLRSSGIIERVLEERVRVHDNHARRGSIGHLPAKGCGTGDGHRAQAKGHNQAAYKAPDDN